MDFGYTTPTKSGILNGDREHFKDDNGAERYPTDVTYPEGVTPRDETVFLAITLEELIIAFPNNRINVKIKQSGELGMKALAEAIRLLDKYDAFDRVVLASFHEEMGFDLATKGFVNAAHKHNLAVHYWTINDVDEMKHLIEIGADGIMTDYPHRLKEVYKNYQ